MGNLSNVITDTVLKQVFEPFGNVLHAVVLMDMTTSQSRGYGFVHMDNATSAANAARGMSGKVCSMHHSFTWCCYLRVCSEDQQSLDSSKRN